MGCVALVIVWRIVRYGPRFLDVGAESAVCRQTGTENNAYSAPVIISLLWSGFSIMCLKTFLANGSNFYITGATKLESRKASGELSGLIRRKGSPTQLPKIPYLRRGTA